MAEYKMNPSCIPKISTGVTEAVWKKRVAEGGWFVKVDDATCTSDEIGVAFLEDDDVVVMGRLIGYTGTGTKFRVTVENCGVRGYAQGDASGAFLSTDYGDRMKAKNGKLIVDNDQTAGNVILVGGTKAEPAVAWQWPYGGYLDT